MSGKYLLHRFKTVFRNYSKNVLHRKPVRIHNLPQSTVTPVQEHNSPHSIISQEIRGTDLLSYKDKQSHIVVPPYEKIQKNDVRFSKVLTTLKSRDLREKKGLILLEGKRLINDAIKSGVKLKTIYFSREKDLADIKLKNLENVEILKVLYKTLCVWSDFTTSPGIMGVFKKPSIEEVQVTFSPVLPVFILCDNIRDPGNLGSIIRNSAAAGCQKILLMKGCVDPWETKVLRSGCGGHFHIPIINNIEWPQLSNYLPKTSTIFIADNSSDTEDSEVDSEFTFFDEIPEDREDEGKYVMVDETTNVATVVDETYQEPSELEKYEGLNLPCHMYSSVKYPKENIVLYVGGETHGVDPKAVKLACEYGGRKVKIPMENDMESLNSAFAMTIILYEIKKQFVSTYITK